MTLAYDVAGDGPTVVLLHSTVCHRRMWDPQVPVLAAAGFRVVRCDLRGYGETPPPSAPWNDADDVAALLDELDAPRVAVIGASGGGRVALELAARAPERVTRLALLCTAAPGMEPGPALEAVWQQEEKLYESGDITGLTDLMVHTFVGPAATGETRAAVGAMQRHNLEVQLAVAEEPEPIRPDVDLAAITAPALLVTGAHDLPAFHRVATGLAATLPGAQHVHLDWAGHLPSLERPADINALLLAFLA
jgi:pimeloyl-ACP methyl ester carboxylesterase